MAEGKLRKSGRAIPAVDGSVNAVAPEVAVNFLKSTMPFKELDDRTLYELARHCRIDFYPKGTRLFTYNESEVDQLYLIQRGGVKAFITDEDGEIVLKDYRGAGAQVGALGIIRGTKANLNIETVEDTFCFLIPREVFLNLVKNDSVVAHYYLKSFSDNIVAVAYSELRSNKLSRRTADDLFLFSATAGDLAKPLFTVSASTSIQEAAAVMLRNSIGSLLIYADEDPGSMIGIITDTDLRGKVVAEGRDFREPVASIMSSPVRTVASKSLCFDVLLKMMTTGIHHLGVEQGGSVLGIVTSHDIMVQQGNSPYYLFKEIAGQNDFDGIYRLSEKVSGIIRNIINEGAKAGNISRMITLINEKILFRILTLLHARRGPAPVKYSWLLFGSEGRGEQTFKTDLDNGLVYLDPENEADAAAVRDYFIAFAKEAVEHLQKCGYPECRQGTMASNPAWNQPLSVWKRYFREWASDNDQAGTMDATVFFDFRYGFGNEQLAVDLRDYVVTTCQQNDQLMKRLAGLCLKRKAPLSFFKTFVVEQNGERLDRLEIKASGLLPFVDFARVLALYHGIRETNTLARLKALVSRRIIDKDLYGSMVEAFELQMQLRVIHQLGQLENGIAPDDFILPEELTDLEKKMFKEAFGLIRRMHGLLGSYLPGD